MCSCMKDRICSNVCVGQRRAERVIQQGSFDMALHYRALLTCHYIIGLFWHISAKEPCVYIYIYIYIYILYIYIYIYIIYRCRDVSKEPYTPTSRQSLEIPLPQLAHTHTHSHAISHPDTHAHTHTHTHTLSHFHDLPRPTHSPHSVGPHIDMSKEPCNAETCQKSPIM